MSVDRTGARNQLGSEVRSPAAVQDLDEKAGLGQDHSSKSSRSSSWSAQLINGQSEEGAIQNVQGHRSVSGSFASHPAKGHPPPQTGSLGNQDK